MTPGDAAVFNVEEHGFAFVRKIASGDECAAFAGHLGEVAKAGRRGLLADPGINALARSERFKNLVAPHLAGEPAPVRAIFFDKTTDRNWLVPWHQDLNVAVVEKRDVPGWGPWSVKDGLVHVRPPAAMLADMITIRLHLDDCDADNGALLVLPETHRDGILDDTGIAARKAAGTPVRCAMTAGDVLLMRPLLLHASGKSVSGRRRRILHVEYAGFRLPEGLEWNPAA